MLSYLINSKMLLDGVFSPSNLDQGLYHALRHTFKVLFTLSDLPLPIALKFTPAQFVFWFCTSLQCHLSFSQILVQTLLSFLDYCQFVTQSPLQLSFFPLNQRPDYNILLHKNLHPFSPFHPQSSITYTSAATYNMQKKVPTHA